MVDSVFVSTDFVEVDERNDFWREVTRPVFETVPLRENRKQPFTGSIRSRIVGELLIRATTFNQQHYFRDPRLSAQSGLDHYLMQLFTSGSLRGDFNGIDVRADLGDICISDLSQTLKSEVEPGSTISVMLPRRLLDKAMGSRNLHGTVLQRRMPMTPLIEGYLHGLCSLEAPLSDAQSVIVEEAIVSLLSAALEGVEPVHYAHTVTLASGLRQRILEFVVDNIYSMELSPNFLCHRFNVSRAHLYRAFASDGGVAKVLRDRRLDAAYRELVQTNTAARSITALAYSLGFSSGNQLLRSFRNRFGMTPSEARAGEGRTSNIHTAEPARQNVDLHAHFARFSSKAQP